MAFTTDTKLPRHTRLDEMREEANPRNVFFGGEAETTVWLLFDTDPKVPFPIFGELKDGKWHYSYVEHIGDID